MITSFDNHIPTVVNDMYELNVDTFEHLGIKYWQDIDARIRYTEHILK